MTTASRLDEARDFDSGRPFEAAPADQLSPEIPQDMRELDNIFIHRIKERVENRRQAISPIHSRMDSDYSMWRLDPFKPNINEGIAPEDAYTSNTPRNVADKVVSLVASAKLLIRVDNDTSMESTAEANNNVERLAIGLLEAGNDRLVKRGEAPLQDQLAWTATVRGGWVAARALLIMSPMGETEVDIKPIDPRHLIIEFGVDGPLWAAIVTQRTRAMIKDEYPGFSFNDNSEENETNRSRVLDYYFWEIEPETGRKIYKNAVIIDDLFAKRPTDTMTTEFPIIARAVGSNPVIANYDIQEGDQTRIIEGIRDFGESIFAPIRATAVFKNRVTTYAMQLTALAAQGIKKVASSDGTKGLPDELEKGDAIKISTLNNEDVTLLEIPQLTRDAQILLGVVTDDESDGTFPPAAFGILQGEESGRALQMLRSNMGERIVPRLVAVESVLQGCIENMVAQFELGFPPITVRGRTFDRQPFDRPIELKDIKGHGRVTVKLTAELPEDRQEKWQIATLSRQPDPVTGLPLASWKTVQDEILQTQDSLLEKQRIYAEQAANSSPLLALAIQLEAAWQEGDQNAAHQLLQEIETLERERQMKQFAQEFAFFQAMNGSQQADSSVATAAAGQPQGRPQAGSAAPGSGMAGSAPVGQPQGAQPSGGQGTPRRPTAGLEPETQPLSGTPLGVGGLNPNPGNMLNELRQRAAAIGLELP